MDKAIVTSNIYRDFAQGVEKFQKDRGNPDVLVSARGLAATFREICIRRATRRHSGQSLKDEDRRLLRLEAETWELLQRVYEHRRKPQGEGRTTQEMLKANAYTPTLALYQSSLSYSPRLAELCEIQKWLESIYRPIEPPLLTNEYWKFTTMDLKQKRRQGQTTRTGYVRTLDPDAVNRIGDSGVLNADDAEEEKSLLDSLFQHIRAGKLEDAIEICQTAARPWRAALLRGSYQLRWDSLNDLSERDTGVSEEIWSGNRRWILWRQMCAEASMSSSLSTTDKALHASIAPSVYTLPALLPMCHTWEDHLWARLGALIGDRVEMKLGETAGGFWNPGSFRDRLALRARLESDVKPFVGQESDWESVIAHQLDELSDMAVETSDPVEDFLRRSQLGVICRKMKSLLIEVEDAFKDSEESLPVESLRFFAHLWLFLNMINASNELSSTRIIEKYIEVLQQSGERDIVALYTSFLGHAAIRKYADFLASMPLGSPNSELDRALRSAVAYHLDVRLVAEEASRLSRDRAAKLLPPDIGKLPDLSQVESKQSLTDAEKHIVRSIAWLRFHASTHALIIPRSNEAIRWLLCHGHISAAIQLSADLPKADTNESGDHVHAIEYLLYRKLLALWDNLSAFEKIKEPQTALNWKRRLEDQIQRLFDDFVEVVTMDWGIESDESDVEDGPAADGDARRIEELVCLRRLFIPEISIRLTQVLMNMSTYIPSAVKLVMELVNLVADGKDKLHLDFVYRGRNRLPEYLLLVKEALITGMGAGGSDPLALAA
ncbi:Nucleoporin nup84 [Serendipita sp. 401]|nr:Nucleoporin nup84 [Serendipita sp. 401]